MEQKKNNLINLKQKNAAKKPPQEKEAPSETQKKRI